MKKLFSDIRAYICMALMIAVSGFFTAYFNLYNGIPNTEYSLSVISIGLMLALPLLTYPVFSKENADGFYSLQSSLGVRPAVLVAGKYLACLTVFTISFLILAIIPIISFFTSGTYLLGAYVGIIGYYLFGAAFIALMLFISAISKNSLVSLIASYSVAVISYFFEYLTIYVTASVTSALLLLTVLALLFAICIYFMTKSEIVTIAFIVITETVVILFRFISPTVFSSFYDIFMRVIAIRERLSVFLYGIFDITAVIHYIVLTAVFVLLTVLGMRKRRFE